MGTETGRDTLSYLNIFLASLFLFTIGLNSQEITGFDSRFYLFAREMLQYGISWFPLTYHQPYPDYPATAIVLIHAGAVLAGGLNKWVAVLPTAIMAAMTVTLTYCIGSIHEKHWGYCAAMMMLLTLSFFKSARAISLDLYPAMMTAMCFYLVYSAENTKQYQRTVWIYPFLFLGFAFRGPIGLVMPIGVVCIYYLLKGKIKKCLLHGLLAFLLLGFCTIVLLALAYHMGGPDFLQAVLQREVLGRMDNYYLPRYFYFTNSFLSYSFSYPLAWLVLAGAAYYVLVRKESIWNQTLLLQLFGWMMIILIGMSIPDDKKVRYLLPMMPAIALIAAYPFATQASQTYFVLLRTFMRGCLLFFPCILLIATLLLPYFFPDYIQAAEIPVGKVSSLLALMFIINVIASGYFYVRLSKFRRCEAVLIDATMPQRSFILPFLQQFEKNILTVALVCFTLVNLMVIEPMQLHLERAHDFVSSIESARLEHKAQLVFYRESPDGLPIKYLVNRVDQSQPSFMNDPKELFDFSGRAYFVTSESWYQELVRNFPGDFQMMARDKLGHVPVVVFMKKRLSLKEKNVA